MHPHALPRLRFGLTWLVCGVLAGLGCQPPAGQGPGHRVQHLILTPEQEYSLGKQAYAEVLAKARKDDALLPSDSPQVERVKRVGDKIEKATHISLLMKEINLNEKDYKFAWEYSVIRSKQVNAFCLPGGFIAVYTGLLPVAEDDAELATVMSHEIAHALAHHANERIAREHKREMAIKAAAGALGRLPEGERHLLVGLLAGGTQIQGLSYDRQQESEADHIGLFLMTFAGYNPDEAIRFWERMEQMTRGTGHPPAILSTHPSNARRIAQLRAWVPQAKAAWNAYKTGNVVH
jgi:metalloendopeptidase OMA1, mitochondrial